MHRVIAVEDNLGPMKDFLTVKGFKVIDIEAAMNQNVDAVILSGSDENLMNMQDIVINAPVINAKGRSPEEIWEGIQRYGIS